ncbi:MAG: tRNA preQ1(34) S-adenosylmethionine ribosyltransferase-isomerase QueA [Dehalococcoidia bacterium]|nr:tRNA preQ1(34) S-adenosylmethionine ribosyltransferase-isomerase QueA [Dehalococcoidia bacterium]
MRTADFDYLLPEHSIAQHPVEPRDSARLLVMHRSSGVLEHRTFHDLVEYLHPGDVLVRNDSRVLRARLLGRRPGSGGRVEALLLREAGAPGVWEVLLKPTGRLKPGSPILFNDGHSGVEIEALLEEGGSVGTRLLRFPSGADPERFGSTPLPPYIHEALSDPERYQTVYAREPGSAAAPTAGLHFTQSLLDEVEAKGVRVVSVTLHVGLDTFRPVREDDPSEHGMHREFYELSAGAASMLSAAAAGGGRFVCVGTTSVRSLEDAVERSGWDPVSSRAGQPPVAPYAGFTGKYILPGYQFRAVDALVTNFHLPKTTLLMLVSAFAGRERVLDAYKQAIRLGYRFYSFGDAMLLL